MEEEPSSQGDSPAFGAGDNQTEASGKCQHSNFFLYLKVKVDFSVLCMNV
jgi:hypothetical protein